MLPELLKRLLQIFENYCKRIVFFKESSYYSVKSSKKKDILLLARKLIETVRDALNAKEHYQSSMTKKNRKSVKQSEIITYQPKTFKNPNTVDIKSVITEHPKTSNNYQRLYERVKK